MIASCSSAPAEGAQNDTRDSSEESGDNDAGGGTTTAFSIGDGDRPPDAPSLAIATLVPASGSAVAGLVIFDPIEDGLIVRIEATGLGQGAHGMHVHEVGDCSALDATSAGAHFDPDGNKLGDLDSIESDAAGTAFVDVLAPGLALWGDSDVVGRSIVIHDPGDPEIRIACGVIEAA